MASKNEFVNNLPHVKLVIGNGFDLHCHLKTSYADYFCHNEEKNKELDRWIQKFFPHSGSYLSFSCCNHKDFWVDLLSFDKFNVWDIFFYLSSKKDGVDSKEWRWCDVESKIEESLNSPKTDLSWPAVYKLLDGHKSIIHDNCDLYVLAGLVYKKHRESFFESEKEFYSFLLDQLKRFEIDFGHYISSLHNVETAKAFAVTIKNKLFIDNASQTIGELCNINNLVSIDSFNFDFVDLEHVRSIFHNINGTTSAPIFGVDSDAFESSDPRFIFTKTNRRMEFDMLMKQADQKAEFENVIVYGHSLNKADYSYFFSLFDKIDVGNLSKNSKVVFAYSIYDHEKQYEIEARLREAIAKLFEDYSKYKGNKVSPNRLLDALTTQGKILMYEIPNINIDSRFGDLRNTNPI